MFKTCINVIHGDSESIIKRYEQTHKFIHYSTKSMNTEHMK